MIDQIRTALASGNLAQVFEATAPDESYLLSFDQGEGRLTGSYYRYGSEVYALTTDTRPGEEECKLARFGDHDPSCADPVACAIDGMARAADAARAAHAMAKQFVPGLGDMTCTHRMADGASLAGTSFADTVIPDGMDTV